MIRTKTVLVVGAGASSELKFPLGGVLLAEIGRALDFNVSSGGVTGGSPRIWRELKRTAHTSGKNADDYIFAAWRVRDATHLGLSIDNVIHQLNDDDLVTYCAKLGIAHKLLVAEGSCDLRIHENNRTMTWPNVRGTWLGGLAQLIVQDKERRSIDDIFENLSIISFNYDRTIQRFLPFALASQFAIPDQQAKEICQRLPVYHPYGSLGPLRWESRTGSVEFGDTDRVSLSTVVSNIRTFTEQIEDESHLAPMREAIGSADRIVFLGLMVSRDVV